MRLAGGILNGDGGSWIREIYDPDALFQLDRFHIYKEIKKKIRDTEAREQIKTSGAEESR